VNLRKAIAALFESSTSTRSAETPEFRVDEDWVPLEPGMSIAIAAKNASAARFLPRQHGRKNWVNTW
jgi:hypothetical protein